VNQPIDLGRAAVREPDVSDARHFRRRVRWLAVTHPLLCASSLTGLVLLCWRGRFFVTLSQRSNVETLTIAFLLLFFAYLTALSLRGAVGGVRVCLFWVRASLARDAEALERKKLALLGERGPGPAAALNKIVERADRPGEPFELAVRDDLGSMGRLRVDGARVDHVDAFCDGSNSLLPYFARKVADLTGTSPRELDVVHWRSTEDEALLQYVAGVDAMRALGRRLEAPLWPTLTLSPAQCEVLERELGALCPALRDEAFLPDWEFQGQHKLPIIPEPLGIISLSKSERRVDPLSSLTSALVVVLVVLALITFFLVRPPWVPGA
jgi:hypothetical protein